MILSVHRTAGSTMIRFVRVQCQSCGAVRVVEQAAPAPCTCEKPRFTVKLLDPDVPFERDRKALELMEEFGPLTIEELAVLMGLDLDEARELETHALLKLREFDW